MPSPVSRGNVILGFGKQPHPIVKTTIIQSNGVRIRTSSDIQARSIFDGIVYSIIVSMTKVFLEKKRPQIVKFSKEKIFS